MTDETCHCGASMQGSDHCPECGCEEYEQTCDHVHATPMTRVALVRGARRRREAEAYLPDRYRVIAEVLVPAYEGAAPERTVTAYLIRGTDFLGWSLDGYIIPRYGSGSIACEEITHEQALDLLDATVSELTRAEAAGGAA